MDRRINIGPELKALRKTRFYLELRPFIKAKGQKYPFAESHLIHDHDDPLLEPNDRYFFALDFVFGDVMRNIRSRRWIKFVLLALLEDQNVDEEGAHFLYRSYLNELVILMERLQRLIELIEIGYGAKTFAQSCDRDVLRFFNPVLAKKRNHNHHSLYLGYARSQEVERAALAGRSKGDQGAASKLFSEVIGKELQWMDGTEDAFAAFLPAFFEKVHGYLRKEASYADPTNLPKNFTITTRLERALRKKYRHEEEFARGMSTKQKG